MAVKNRIDTYFLTVLLVLIAIIPADSSFSLPADFSSSDPLFIIYDEVGKGVRSLEELPVELYQKMPPYYLVSISTGSRSSIEKKGFACYEIVGIEMDKPLYLLTPHVSKAALDQPSGARILFRGEGWFLVQAGDIDISQVAAKDGFFFSIIPLHPLPFKNSRKCGVLSPTRAYLSPAITDRALRSDSTITSYLERLEAFQTRFSYSDSVVAAAEWIYDKFVEFGYTDVEYDSFRLAGTWQRNVVATKIGTVTPGEVIVIGGHYDTIITRDSECDHHVWAPGADDDGSGTALTLDMARILAGEDLEATLKFVAFASEEQGLYGSWHFAEEAYNSGMDIRLMINIDMVGTLSDDILDVLIHTDDPSIGYAQLMSTIARDNTDLIPEIAIEEIGADNWPFLQYGYNSVWVQEADFSTHYHECTDLLEFLDVPYMVQVEEMIVPTIIAAANAPSSPTGLTAWDRGDGQRIDLEWEAIPDPDLWGYHVYSGSAGWEYDHVDTSFVNSFQMENLVTGESLYISVSALDNDGHESILTEPVGVIPLLRPRSPEGFDVLSSLDEIELTWNGNEEIDLAGYILYRKERGSGAYAPIDTLTPSEETFIDRDVQTHQYYLYEITAFDTGGIESDPSVEGRGRLTTHDSGILVIDATADGSGGPFAPTDEEVDLFYEWLLGGYDLRAQWNYFDSLAIDRRPTDADLAIYSTIIYHEDGRYVEDLAPDTVSMRRYLDSGGNLLISGWSFLTSLSGDQEVFHAGSFFYDYLKIASFITLPSAFFDFHGARASGGDYPDISIDEEKVPTGGLFELNAFDVSPVMGEGIYTYVSIDSTNSSFQGAGMGLECIGGDFGVIVLNFPLYYMDSLEAQELMENAMESFGEEPYLYVDKDLPGGRPGVPQVFSLGQNYPNPFNPSTTIHYSIPGSANERVSLKIYDLRGRLVRTVVDEVKRPGAYLVHWDGRDDRGEEVGSGIFLYTIRAGNFKSTKRMTIIR